MRFNSLITISFLFLSLIAGSSTVAQASLPVANDVVAQMLVRDAQRQHSLEGYEGMRRYTLVNEHMGKRAEMLVRVRGDRDGTKHFEIVTETGWKAAQKHVLHKMLDSEAEASRPEERVKARLSPDNSWPKWRARSPTHPEASSPAPPSRLSIQKPDMSGRKLPPAPEHTISRCRWENTNSV